ncbi:Ku protein [Streptacidiphilus sp. EB129]|uniref:non-homologous end joining protein Ku n=1 Tax=Streptacidiphilus sp. EB129 TaxID=3156262 RepID=UPI003514649C
MRSMWKGSITFGLVSVPVALFKATEEHAGPAAHMVHEKDGGRIKLKRFCEAEDTEVPYSEIAKCYESDDGREAVITSADLAELPLPSKKVIDVLAFVDADSIDPLRLSSPYYVAVADKSPAKPYLLLRDALTEAGQIAVTKVTLQTRESLAVLRVYGELIVLQTLLWPDEIREPEGLAPQGESEVRPQELKMARSLMDTLSEDFDLDALHDTYGEALQQVIEAKLEGVPVVAGEPAATGGAKVLDLMEALRSSVKAASAGHAKASARAESPAGTEAAAEQLAAPKTTAAKARTSTARASTAKAPVGTATRTAATSRAKAAPTKTTAKTATKTAGAKTTATKTTATKTAAKADAAKSTAKKSSPRRAS